MLKLKTGLVSVAAAAGLFGAGHAAAYELSWSYSATGVGHCVYTGAPCNTATGLTYDQQTVDYASNHNAASVASVATRGSAIGSANPGSGFLAAPQLHGKTVAAPFLDGAYSWIYSQVQGVQGYTWTGAATDLSLSAFTGALDFTVSGGGTTYGEASAAFAILDHTVGESQAEGDFWFKQDASYGFLGACSDTGAIAIAETGSISGQGAHTATLNPTCGGASTFHLETGETFYLWARLQVFTAGFSTTDASHTFSIGLSPDASPELVTLLSNNLVRAAPLDLGSSAPEPASWALMLLGFGGLGTALRRRRDRITLAA